MPWTQSSAVDMRTRFVVDALNGRFKSHAELCRRYGISRKTGYKWLDRYKEQKWPGLLDRSHRTLTCPLLGCHGLPDTSCARSKPVFLRLFREFGLPDRMRSDNGTPFASNALGRLSRLSVWFVRLGVLPEFIEPASPYQNGKHENMHLVLKRQATRPLRANLRGQQQVLNHFRTEYNLVRPHEALNGAVPGDLYHTSTRPLPKQLPPLSYPPHFEVRRVSTNGGIRWHKHWINVSSILAEQPIGLRKLTPDSSTSISVPSGSAAWSRPNCTSLITWDALNDVRAGITRDDNCNPRLLTRLLPRSFTGHNDPGSPATEYRYATDLSRQFGNVQNTR